MIQKWPAFAYTKKSGQKTGKSHLCALAHWDTPPPLRHADVLNGWSLMTASKTLLHHQMVMCVTFNTSDIYCILIYYVCSNFYQRNAAVGG